MSHFYGSLISLSADLAINSKCGKTCESEFLRERPIHTLLSSAGQKRKKLPAYLCRQKFSVSAQCTPVKDDDGLVVTRGDAASTGSRGLFSQQWIQCAI